MYNYIFGSHNDPHKLFDQLVMLIPKTLLLTTIYSMLLSLEMKAQGPPIFTDTPIMFGVQGRVIRTFGNIISKENANIYSQFLVLPYNITSKWQVGAALPYVSISPEGVSSRFGFWDLKVFTKYQLYQKDGKGMTFREFIKLTETFPTGNSSKMPTLGSGAYQTTLSLVNGYITTKYGIYGEVGYNISGNGLPDSLIYNIAVGYPLVPQKYPPNQLNLFLELNGNYAFDNIGNNLYLSPGIQYIAGRKLLFESGIQIPLTDAAPISQLTNYILRIGT